MSPREEKIRNDVRSGWITLSDALGVVKKELEAEETPSLLILQAVLTQLVDDPSETLEDARLCLERAIALAPDGHEAYEELGHFYDAVMPDREKAETFYRLALARGAGAGCQEALDELLAE